jgi:peptidoglycan/LPS O-acetylase OafA/YrhL
MSAAHTAIPLAARPQEDIHGIHLIPPAAKSKPKVHFFVHTVRFWSMAAIIAMHSLPQAQAAHGITRLQMLYLDQTFKFGTIGFFLISGFLMGNRLQTSRPLDYLRRRVSSIVTPWLFWLMLFAGYSVIADLAHHRIHISSASGALTTSLREIENCVRRTSYWFVPNLFVGMSCLLLFRKHLKDLRFGAVLLAVNLFYVVNIYARWLPSSHTDATFGFVIYLWLGAWSALHMEEIKRGLTRVPLSVHLTLIALAGAAACAEINILQRIGVGDPINTLRLTNQIFSVLVVLLMMRSRVPTWPRFIDVPSQTYGLYLLHPLALIGMNEAIHRFCPNPSSTAVVLGQWVVSFFVAYAMSLMLTKALLSFRGLRALVGGKAPQAEKQKILVFRPQPTTA